MLYPYFVLGFYIQILNPIFVLPQGNQSRVIDNISLA